MSEGRIIQLKPKKTATKKTKAQAEYARLLKQVTRSNKDVESLRAELEQGIQWINANVLPRMSKWNTIKVDIAEQLVDELPHLESGSDIEGAILSYVNQALNEINSTPLLNKETYEEKLAQVTEQLHLLTIKEINSLSPNEKKEAKKIIRLEFEEMLNDMQERCNEIGLKVDFSDLNYEKDGARLQAIMEERMMAAMLNNNQEKESSFESTADDLGDPNARNSDKPQKALNELYRELAKMVHPDLEQDESIRGKKEEWMKSITRAYNDGDLAALIVLQIEIAQKLKINLTENPEDRLKKYSAYFKELLVRREAEIEALLSHPKYYPLHFYTEPFGGFEYLKSSKSDLISQMTDEMLLDLDRLKGLREGKAKRFAVLDDIFNEMMADDFFDFDEDILP